MKTKETNVWIVDIGKMVGLQAIEIKGTIASTSLRRVSSFDQEIAVGGLAGQSSKKMGALIMANPQKIWRIHILAPPQFWFLIADGQGQEGWRWNLMISSV